MLPVSLKKSFDTERWIMTPTGGTVVQVLGLRPASPSPRQNKRVQASLQTDPATLCQTPIGLQTEGARTGGGRRREEELWRSRGVLALVASSHSKSFFKLLKKDLLMYIRLKRKRLFATQSLWDIYISEERPISGLYSNLFF